MSQNVSANYSKVNKELEKRRRSRKQSRHRRRTETQTRIKNRFLREELCVSCRENSLGLLGPLIDPCECRNENKRYHYECLCQFLEITADRPCIYCREKHVDPQGRIVREKYSGPSFAQFWYNYLFGENRGRPRREGLTDVISFASLVVLFSSFWIKIIFFPYEGDHWAAPIVLIAVVTFYYLISWRYQHLKYLREFYGRPHDVVKFTKLSGDVPNDSKIIDMTVRDAILRAEELEEQEHQIEEMIALGDLQLEE